MVVRFLVAIRLPEGERIRMTVEELRQLLDGYDGADQVIVAIDNKAGGIDMFVSAQQEYDTGMPNTFGLFATE